MIKTKNILLTTSLIAIFVGSSAFAGEKTHFYRDPVAQDKHLRLKTAIDRHDKEKTSLLSSKKHKATKVRKHSSINLVLKRINIVGNKSINFTELQSTIKPYMNRNLNSQSVNITEAIEQHYKDAGYLLPMASIESHNSASGAITVRVTEGKIQEVMIETDKEDTSIKNNPLLKKYVDSIVNMSPAKTKEIQKYILLIEKIPGYQVEYQLQPINTHGNNLADLLIAVKKTRGSLNLDATNHGNRDLGRYQFSGFTKLNNPFGFNESVILSAGTSNHTDSLKLASLGYLKRLNAYGTSLSFLGSWLNDNAFKHSKTNKGSADDNKSLTFRGTLSQYLALNNQNSFKLEAGAEYRDVENNIIGQKSIEYDYTMAFIKGKIKHVDFLNAKNWFIPSYNTTVNKAKIKAYETGVYQFDRNFSFINIDWFRDQPLFKTNFSIYTQVMYHYTGDKLPTEHQFFIGSNSVGRGYKSGLVNANKGSAADLELRYTKEINNKVIEVLQPYVFGDVAHFSANTAITNNETTTSTFNKKTLYSAGGGVRIFLTHGFNGEIEAGIPLDKKIKINNVETRNKNKYSFLLSKSFKW